MEFLERLEKDPEGLTKVTIAEYAKLGGMEGAEVVMWLLMRGALSKKVRKLHQTYYLPSMTPICSVIFENDSVDPVDRDARAVPRAHDASATTASRSSRAPIRTPSSAASRHSASTVSCTS